VNAITFSLAHFSNNLDFLSPIQSACVLNQSCGQWLFNDTLSSTKTMCLKLKEEITNALAQDNLIDVNSKVAIELAFLASNIKKEVCVVL
jgi:hypothetical protein